MIERITYTSNGYRVTCDCCQRIIAEHDEFSAAVSLARHNGGYNELWWNGVKHCSRWHCSECIHSDRAKRGEEAA